MRDSTSPRHGNLLPEPHLTPPTKLPRFLLGFRGATLGMHADPTHLAHFQLKNEVLVRSDLSSSTVYKTLAITSVHIHSSIDVDLDHCDQFRIFCYSITKNPKNGPTIPSLHHFAESRCLGGHCGVPPDSGRYLLDFELLQHALYILEGQAAKYRHLPNLL